MTALFVFAAAVAVSPPPAHMVEIGQFSTHLPAGSPILNSTETVTVYYPQDLDNGPYPVVSFAHAMFTGGPIGRPTYKDLLTEIASYGLIVVAPNSCLVRYCDDFWKDQLAALDAVKNVSNFHAFAHADLNRTGVVGHGMGGQASEQNGGPEGAGHNIYATVPINPQSRVEWAQLINVPAFYTTGSLDDVVPAANIKRAYEATEQRGSYYLNLLGGTHNECTNYGKGRLNLWIALFLKCNLDAVHGPTYCRVLNQNVCSANEYVECLSK
ncbi:hypothetical protein DIPPA_28328 [Diplonema papillatum]|nr:hypothetical protein DIPPA_28328 [Diplonema papillatum]